MTTVMQQLADVTEVSRKPGEAVQPFLTRLYKKAAAIPDTEWRKLDDTTQTWINSAGDAVEAKSKLTAPEGFEDLEEVADEPAEVEEAEAEEALPRRKVTTKAAKAPKEVKVTKVAKPKKVEKPAKVAKVKGGNVVPKAAKAKKHTNGQTNGRGRPAAFSPDAKIRLLVKENPHRAGSGRFKRWPKYRNGMTVKEALSAGLNTGNLHYSVADGHISIG